MGGITSNNNTEFNPHVPYTCTDVDGLPDCSRTAPGVHMSEFKNDTMAFYTIVNRKEETHAGSEEEGVLSELYLSLPCQNDTRFFNLYEAVEVELPKNSCRGCENGVGASCVGRITFSVQIEAASGIGAVASMGMNSHEYADQVAAIEKLLRAMSRERNADGPVLWRKAKTSPPLQQSLTSNSDTPITPLPPPGMVTVPSGLYTYKSSNNCLEGDQLSDAVGVQMPWQAHPSRSQQQLIRMRSFHIDKHLVTNEEYRRYVDRGDGKYYAPIDRQNWLKDWYGGMIPSGASNHPVRWVSRLDADAYCRYYGKRLPTSWEWQYAAQGTDGRRYPWGNTWDPSLVARLSNEREDPPTEDVDAHPGSASPFGVEDMVGHLYQWTDESCDEHTCRAILRGGSNYYPMGSPWYFPQPGCGRWCQEYTPRGDLGVHNTLLLHSDSMDRSASVGFRCVVDAEPPPHECVFQLCGRLETGDPTSHDANKHSWSNDKNHDLTTEGTAGWITWGPDPDCSGSPTIDNCAAVTNEKRGFQHIVRATSLSGVKLTPFEHAPHSLAYTDGVHPLSETNVETGVVVQGLGDGFAIHLPASLNTRTVAKLYVGVFCGRGELSITLNDGETHYENTGLLGVTSMVSGVYTIEYETADKWPIEARWVLSESTAEPRSGVEPTVALQAVTLNTSQPLKPGPSPAPPEPPEPPPPAVPTEGYQAMLAGGVLLAGLIAGLVGGVLCGRRCMRKQLETSYELEDWSELEEPIRPLTSDASVHWHLFSSEPPGAQAAPAEDMWSDDDTGLAAGRSERVV